MNYDFDRPIDRKGTDSIKWGKYPADVLPLWVADTDFQSPPGVLEALRRRVDHGVFGYGADVQVLTNLLVHRLEQLYAWKVEPKDILFLPGVVQGFNLACLAFARENERVLVQSPVYPLLLKAPYETGREGREVGFVRDTNGKYLVDWEAFDAAVSDDVKLFILCNPQNPLGRVFTQTELERMAEACLRQGAVICSDEIHCDLVYEGHRHIPIASLAPEIAKRTITLMAPSKTFNLAGLQCSFAVIQDETLRRQFISASRGLLSHLNILGCTAAVAAYESGQGWLEELLSYLRLNRDTLVAFVAEHMPGVRVEAPEGTYLAWLDCTAAAELNRPYSFFLKQARVALSNGIAFGAAGEGHVRVNFGCRRALLLEALERMKSAHNQARCK